MWHMYLALLLLCRQCLADDYRGVFIIPTASGPQGFYAENNVWTLGSKQTIKWTTTMEMYRIELFNEIPGVRADPMGTVYS